MKSDCLIKKLIEGSKLISYENHKNIQNNKDMFFPIVGTVYRSKNGLCNLINEYVSFSFNKYFDTLKNDVNVFEGPVSLFHDQLNLNIHICLEMARYKTVCMIYADDDEFFYVCKFKKSVYQFVQIGRIKKLPYDDTFYKYKITNLFIVNAKHENKGILFLRLYYNEPGERDSLIGYEQKLTSSKYDVPAEDCILDLFTSRSILREHVLDNYAVVQSEQISK